MFPGLGHDAIICGDREQNEVEAGGAGQHVLHEMLVSRYVDDSREAPAGQLEFSESQVDGDAPLFLFLEPVRVDTGQSLNELGFAVIDMPGRPYYEVAHAGVSYPHASLMRTMMGMAFLLRPSASSSGVRSGEVRDTTVVGRSARGSAPPPARLRSCATAIS